MIENANKQLTDVHAKSRWLRVCLRYFFHFPSIPLATGFLHSSQALSRIPLFHDLNVSVVVCFGGCEARIAHVATLPTIFSPFILPIFSNPRCPFSHIQLDNVVIRRVESAWFL